MRSLLCVLLSFSVLFAGCAGREANPVPISMPGDENASCQVLFAEMQQVRTEMEKLKPKTNKFATNTLWGIAGFFLIFPFFFMDVKDAEKIEYDAYQRRYNRLELLATAKNCGAPGQYAVDPDDPNGPARKIIGYRADRSRKDADGNPVLVPVYEDEQKK